MTPVACLFAGLRVREFAQPSSRGVVIDDEPEGSNKQKADLQSRGLATLQSTFQHHFYYSSVNRSTRCSGCCLQCPNLPCRRHGALEAELKRRLEVRREIMHACRSTLL